MIEKVRIRNYRKFRDVTFTPHPRFNVLVGENEAGKSTLLEAMILALTGRVNGRIADEELNPYWFNQNVVHEFFDERKKGMPVGFPEIIIEVFLREDPDYPNWLYGAHNSDSPTRESAGVSIRITLDSEYAKEAEQYLKLGTTTILPVEYYMVEWKTFGDSTLVKRPKELSTAIIDSRTVRSSSGIDYYLRSILNDYLTDEERATISLSFRLAKEQMTTIQLKSVNEKMENDLHGALEDKRMSVAMDQSARGAWDASVIPQVAELPFAMAGQGQQAVVKTILAMGRRAKSARVVMIEEPDNHLSHTSLNKLLNQVQKLASEGQQLFVTTHSSFVLNRLGLNSLQLISDGKIATFGDVSDETVSFFQKQPGYDTLRMAIARRFVLVEGPSDEILFDRFFADAKGGRPIESGIDVISMRGLSLKRGLELAKTLNKRCAVLRDNDGVEPTDIIQEIPSELIETGKRQVFIGAVSKGKTLEPQVVWANSEETICEILGVQDRAKLQTWMTNNKTEAALRLAESEEHLNPPAYFAQAIEFISDDAQ